MRFQSAGADEPCHTSRRVATLMPSDCGIRYAGEHEDRYRVRVSGVFDVLNLSLFGKAQEKGLVTVTAHNLRELDA